MNNVKAIIDVIQQSPDFLENLLQSVPLDKIKLRKTKNSWTAHEHACHVCVGDKFSFHKRFILFKDESFPQITPISGADFPGFYYRDMDLKESLKEFRMLRKQTIAMVKTCSADFWIKEAFHPEYVVYTPLIMLRHLLMHDYFHFYKIEDLLLGR